MLLQYLRPVYGFTAGRALGVFILDGDDDVLHKTGIHTAYNKSLLLYSLRQQSQTLICHKL